MPGHRGIDVAAIGEDVLAPADGIVRFAGIVVDRGVLSIDHGDGVVSSYEPVTALVAEGGAVERGQVVARLEPGHCATPCLHFGVRVDGAYRNPLRWLGGAEWPVLLPTRRIGAVASGPRMGETVALAELLDAHVGVELRRPEARVPEELLDDAEIGPAVEQMRRGGVPERVRPAWAGRGVDREQALDEPVQRPGPDPPAAGAEEERGRIGLPAPGEHRPHCQPAIQCARGRCAEGHDPLLGPLTEHPYRSALEVEIGEVESGELARSQR